MRKRIVLSILFLFIVCIPVQGQSKSFLTIDYKNHEDVQYGLKQFAYYDRNQYISKDTDIDFNKSMTSLQQEQLAYKLSQNMKCDYYLDYEHNKLLLDNGVYVLIAMNQKMTPMLIYVKENVCIEPKIDDSISIKINKVDQNGKLIKDSCTFALNDENICIERVNTNNGIAIISIPNGDYTITEVKAPTNYILSKEVIHVQRIDDTLYVNNEKVDLNDSAYTLSFVNHKEINTAFSLNQNKWIILCMASLGFILNGCIIKSGDKHGKNI
ncbi:MSCRAMM family protein [Floccifex sp.]|uniref:MSCRAMM family protein n=1 Tax=Floccifex sp. TaxID=2815810 RepID=UPI002A748DCA|nr:prealbumin-like fold domain-containing protein [Floccifex sp.]MDD7281475.1 prealbumin-like fold domain-containing protein [Erysipelotrichaceae bacterium]MDY2957726.1 prealbumin-like fold domain-containing protein [Floccifex sp.]